MPITGSATGTAGTAVRRSVRMIPTEEYYAITIREVARDETTSTAQVTLGPGLSLAVYWVVLVPFPFSTDPLPEDLGAAEGALNSGDSIVIDLPAQGYTRWLRVTGYDADGIAQATREMALDPPPEGTGEDQWFITAFRIAKGVSATETCSTEPKIQLELDYGVELPSGYRATFRFYMDGVALDVTDPGTYAPVTFTADASGTELYVLDFYVPGGGFGSVHDAVFTCRLQILNAALEVREERWSNEVTWPELEPCP